MFMICPHCNKNTPEGSKFCQNCGEKISVKKIWRKFHISKKIFLSTFTILIISALAFISAARVKASYQVYIAIKASEDSLNHNDYQKAFDTLEKVKDSWSINSQKNQVKNITERANKYINDSNLYIASLEDVKNNKLNEARDKLKQIPIDYPEYSKVKDEIDVVQNAIEDNLKRDADEREKKAQAAADSAKKQAAAAAKATAKANADKAAAEAQAAAASAQQAAAEAQAAAAAQAAASANAQAEALRNQQSSAYIDKWQKATDYIASGHKQISQASSYISSGSYSNALSYLIYALDDYTSAKNVLGTSYIPEMATAHKYLQLAIDSYISEEVAYFNAVYYLEPSYLSQAETYRLQGNNYIDLANTYIGKY
jgi:hypothetical protein